MCYKKGDQQKQNGESFKQLCRVSAEQIMKDAQRKSNMQIR